MLAVVPVLIPFLTGVLLVLMLRQSGSARRSLSLASFFLQAIFMASFATMVYKAGTVVSPLGSWTDPIGIVLVADKAAVLLAVLATVVSLAAALTGTAENAAKAENPLRQPLLHFLLSGIQLSFLTGDLFNLFVAFEVMLLASYALMSLEAKQSEIRQTFPYVLLNVLSSAFFLAACGFTYALFGTLNFAQISEAATAMASTPEGTVRVALLTGFLAVVFSIKAGMFPLYYWLPNSYPTLPPAVVAVYAGLLTKVGLFVLLRLLGTVMPPIMDPLYALIAVLGGASMIFGVLGAISRSSVREILAFHSLSQVGFMLLGIGIFTPFGFAACLFFMIHHSMVKAGLFLTAGGIIFHLGTDSLKKTGGLWRAQPLFRLSFLLLALSLAGLPPFSGFWAKLWVLLEGLREGHYVLIAVALVASILTLASMVKIWLNAFWNDPPEGTDPPALQPQPAGLRMGISLLLAVSLAMVFLVQPIWQISREAADDLFHPTSYIQSVQQALNPTDNKP